MPTPRAPQFRLLGFPVHVGYGFVLFMVLLAFVPRGSGQEFGYWLAGGVAAFTLLHELGHALVARHVGAEAGISLEFMAGYTSYRPTRPISRPWSIAISLAGPVVHIASGVAVLALMRVNPLDLDSVRETYARQAIWWAGPIIGLLNLVPVLPLDGGNVVATALDAIVPGRGRSAMVYVSVAVTAGALVSTIFFDATRPFTVFIGFLLIVQLGSLFDERSRRAVSPFDTAAAAMRAGDRRKAVRTLTRGLQRPSPRRLVPQEMATTPDGALADAVAALPRPLPRGDEWNEYLLASLLVRFGSAREAAEYAAACYHDEPSPLSATAVARAAASLGDAPTAAGWLRAAHDAGLGGDELRRVVLAAPEFVTVRSSAEVQSVLAGVGTAPTAAPRRT